MPGQIPGVGNVFLLDGSGVPVTITNTTGIVTLASIIVPGRVMGLNGQLWVTALWSFTNSANAKNCRILWGGSVCTLNGNQNLNASQAGVIIRNRNAPNSQIVHNGGLFATQSAAPSTYAANTDADVPVAFQCDMAALGETVTLEGYAIMVMRC